MIVVCLLYLGRLGLRRSFLSMSNFVRGKYKSTAFAVNPVILFLFYFLENFWRDTWCGIVALKNYFLICFK